MPDVTVIMIILGTIAAIILTTTYFSTHTIDSGALTTHSHSNLQVRNFKSSSNESDDKVNVDLYYEVLCPDSRAFVLYQLYPAWESMRDIFRVNFIPYGKAYTYNAGDRFRFSCQHGPAECQGNTYHACAAAHIRGEEELMEYIRCMINDNYDPPRAALRCSREIEVDWAAISECAKGLEGNKLHKEAGDKTNALVPRVTFIPTIELDGGQFNQRYVRQNFKQQLCQMYKGLNTPEECATK